jgi:hypothetical protein
MNAVEPVEVIIKRLVRELGETLRRMGSLVG